MSKFWLDELERAGKEERDWRKRANKVIKRYVDERDDDDKKTKFNILWSSTETLRPALISSVPVPEVRQRYKKNDPVARLAAKILERALEFSLDTYDFIKYGKAVVQDVLLPGRGVSRVRYIPTFEKRTVIQRPVEEGGETMFLDTEEVVDELVFEEVRAERVPWKWFRCDPADCWENVRWVAFGAPYTKDEGLNEFGKKFEGVDIKKSETEDHEHSEAMKDKIIVWEIWDKRTRKQMFMAEEHDFMLEENDDPLRLENFFPMEEPVYAVEENDTLVPTPEFTLWQDQADELDELSARIEKVTKAIRAGGAYAGELKNELTEILTSSDNELVAVEDWIAFANQGGLEGVISWIPTDVFAKVLQILEAQRAIKVQEIFELTGISDLQRGASDPRETARAQQLKANFGSRRLLTKQQAIQNHFRDIFRIKAEIIAEQFDEQTLRLMVGLENENEYWDQAIAMIKNDALRMFNVDIETDTTIAPDEEMEKRGLAEAMTAVAQFSQAIFPLVQAGAVPMPVAVGLLSDYLRKFRFGRKLDDLLQDMAQMQAPPDPQQQQEQQQKQLEMQTKQAETELKLREMQAKMQMQIQDLQAKLGMDAQEHQQEMRQDEEKHDQELRQAQEMHAVDLSNKRELASVQRQQAASNVQ